MSQSELFIKAFANLESWLRQSTNAERAVPFYQVVERAAECLPSVRRFRDDLKEFADLRNAIIHERTDGHPIAEPNTRAVEDIQRLETLLTSPPMVVSHFRRKVVTAEETWSLSRAVKLMEARRFSQLPVTRAARFVALLTANTVTRWLGAKAAEDIVSINDATVAQVLMHTEDSENYVFIGRTASLFDALAKFGDFEERGKPLDAVLVTHSGSASDSLLGIITIYDVPKMFALLQPTIRRRKKSAGYQ